MGSRVRIATVCQAGAYYPTIEQNREHVMGLLDLALSQKPDLVCLPETFTTVNVDAASARELAETVPGPTIKAAAQRAKEHRCYVICPIKTLREGVVWNSAVILDREGEVAGIYDKVHPVTTSEDYTVFEGGVSPSPTAPVFDLDFGRVGVQICFDAGFPETWAELAAAGARLVFWPSAYNGGFPLRAYAYLHHYYVVSSVRTDRARVIDPLGDVRAETDVRFNVVWQDINLDYAVCHYDFNHAIPDRILAAYGPRVSVRSHRDDGHFLVEPVDDAITIEALQREFGFETTALYHQRHRDAFQSMLAGDDPAPQRAAHRSRAQYSK